MNTVAEMALRSVVGLLVIAAMFLTIWVARDSSADAAVAATQRQAESPELHSTHRPTPGRHRTDLRRSHQE